VAINATDINEVTSAALHTRSECRAP